MERLQPLLQKIARTLRRNGVLFVIIIFGVMYGFILFTSTQLAAVEPGESEINEKFQGVSRPKIDKAVAEKLEQLEDQNIEVKALFEEARNNPFSE